MNKTSRQGWAFCFLIIALFGKSNLLLSLNSSDLTLAGRVLFSNPFTVQESEPYFNRIVLVQEGMNFVDLDVEYFLPKEYEEKQIEYTISIKNRSETRSALVGQRVDRIRFSGKGDYFESSRSLSFDMWERVEGHLYPIVRKQEIPFQKIWINFRCDLYSFLKTIPTMTITQMDPPFFFVDQRMTLYGNFGNFKNWDKRRCFVLLAGNGFRIDLKIIDWQHDMITIKPIGIDRFHQGNRILDPSLPFFLCVVAGGKHSNLFLVKLNPSGKSDRRP